MAGEQRYQIPVLLDQDGIHIIGVDDLYVHDFISKGISTERQVFQEQCAVITSHTIGSDRPRTVPEVRAHRAAYTRYPMRSCG